MREEFLTDHILPIGLLDHARWYYVYRYYDGDDVLLYVGMTADPHTRWLQHKGRKPWAAQVSSFRVERFAYMDLALDREKAIIASESPIHNVRSTRRGNAEVADRANAWRQAKREECTSNAQARPRVDATDGRTGRTHADALPTSVDIAHLVTRASSSIDEGCE